jgi:hypothetical protein
MLLTKWVYCCSEIQDTIMANSHTHRTLLCVVRGLRSSPRGSQKNPNRWEPDHVAPQFEQAGLNSDRATLCQDADFSWKSVPQPVKAEPLRDRPCAHRRSTDHQQTAVFQFTHTGLDCKCTVLWPCKIIFVVAPGDSLGTATVQSCMCEPNMVSQWNSNRKYTIQIFINATQSTVVVQSWMWELWVTIWDVIGLRKLTNTRLPLRFASYRKT